MTSQDLKNLILINPLAVDTDEEYNIPLDLSDIISICQEYNKLGWSVQPQVDAILEFGVEESIKNNKVKKSALQSIKRFLSAINSNPYFGDAAAQSKDAIKLITAYEDKNKIHYGISMSN